MNTLPTRIRFRKLRPEAVMPTYAHPGDSGMDLVAVGWRYHDDAKDRCRAEPIRLHFGERVLVYTGIAMEIPMGLELQVRPRSGLSLKQGLHVVWGTCDSGYVGEIGVTCIGLQDDNHEPIVIPMGTKVAQGVLAPVVRARFEEVEDLGTTARGTSGYGSSDVEAA